jgi:hypothetical protein
VGAVPLVLPWSMQITYGTVSPCRGDGVGDHSSADMPGAVLVGMFSDFKVVMHCLDISDTDQRGQSMH